MFTIVNYSTEQKELKIIESKVLDKIAMLSDDDCKCHSFSNYSELESFLSKFDICDAICFDITDNNGISNVEAIRKQYRDSLIMLIADMSISPVEYMKPSIMAASLVIRPSDDGSFDKSISMLIEALLKRNTDDTDSDAVMSVNTGDGKIRIPYSDIMYFEAREKKIFISTNNHEYALYSTLDKLSQELPDSFVRCHKSFIVNKNKVFRVFLSRNEIELIGEHYVPVSRTYKPLVKAM